MPEPLFLHKSGPARLHQPTMACVLQQRAPSSGSRYWKQGSSTRFQAHGQGRDQTETASGRNHFVLLPRSCLNLLRRTSSEYNPPSGMTGCSVMPWPHKISCFWLTHRLFYRLKLSPRHLFHRIRSDHPLFSDPFVPDDFPYRARYYLFLPYQTQATKKTSNSL